MDDFETLVAEAWNAPFSGWDFGWLASRQVEHQPSWSYPQLAQERLRASRSALDMDTGGGELLSTLGPFPPQMAATESYIPNVAIARARLEPLGIRVTPFTQNAHLPFRDRQFDLALNRHGAYSVLELRRILEPGGLFLTQQVGGINCMRLNELLQDEPVHPYAYWTLAYARAELERLGFQILQAREETPELIFKDIGAVVYFLKAIPWQIEGFAPEKCMDRLARIHELIQSEGELVVPEHRFLLEAQTG